MLKMYLTLQNMEKNIQNLRQFTGAKLFDGWGEVHGRGGRGRARAVSSAVHLTGSLELRQSRGSDLRPEQ